jgi:hypothetical protein
MNCDRYILMFYPGNHQIKSMAAGYHVTWYLPGILHDITSQKAVILIVTAFKVTILTTNERCAKCKNVTFLQIW